MSRIKFFNTTLNEEPHPLIDFTYCQLTNTFYGGSEDKIGIIYKNEPYILKFPKLHGQQQSLGYVSEYIGRHIFKSLQVPVHDTLLGTYNGQHVVVLKDFIDDCSILQEFANIGESSLDSLNDAEHHAYDYSEIVSMIFNNKKLSDKQATIETFWKMFVVDALLGNFDRHGYNWGYLKDTLGNYTIAPVYDNGSCLFPRLEEEKISEVLADEQELKLRTYTFPTSQIKINGKKSSYFDVISSVLFEQCDLAVIWLHDTIDFNKINQIIDKTPIITSQRKAFLKQIIKYRYENIILHRYNMLRR